MALRTGLLLVISGPSGSGKTTLCRRLADCGQAHYSISCTTRAPRAGEIHGKDYHFLTEEEFARRLAAGEFIEHAVVHGNRYGSLRSEIIGYLHAGVDVVMDIDVQGAQQVRTCPDPDIRRAAVDLFVLPPNDEELHQRLAGRGTDTAETVSLRMTNALEEMRQWRSYTYLLRSADRDTDFAGLMALVTAERMRVSRLA